MRHLTHDRAQPFPFRRLQATQRTLRSVTRSGRAALASPDAQLAIVSWQPQSKASRAPRATKLVGASKLVPSPARITAAIGRDFDHRACSPPDRCDHDPARPRGREDLRYKPNGAFQRMLVENGGGWEPRFVAPCHPSDDTAAWLVPIRKRRYFGGNHRRMYARVDGLRVCLDAPGTWPGHRLEVGSVAV